MLDIGQPVRRRDLIRKKSQETRNQGLQGYSVNETGERINGGAVKLDKSPENEAILDGHETTQSMSADPCLLGDVRDAHALTNCVHELRWEVGTAAPASLGSLDIVAVFGDCDVESDFAYSPTFEIQQQQSSRLRCPLQHMKVDILSSPTQLKHKSSRHRKRKTKVQASATSKKETRMKKAQGEHGNNNHRAIKDIYQNYINHLMQSRGAEQGNILKYN